MTSGVRAVSVRGSGGETQLPIAIDRGSPLPLYRQVAEQLAAAVREGRLEPGDALESEPSLGAHLSISRLTARQALADLVRQGVLVRRRGIGTVVAGDAIRRQTELTAPSDGPNGMGQEPLTEVLAFRTSHVDYLAATTLGLDPAALLVYVERLSSVHEGPMSISRTWLPSMWRDLDASELAGRGLYGLMRARGTVPAVVHYTVAARPATPEDRKLLRAGTDHPMLAVRHVSYDRTGMPSEVGEDAFRHDRYAFDVTVHAS